MIREKSCGAVIFAEKNGGRLYLVERMQKGHFSLCKGHVEGDETEYGTASREIREETGLDVEFIPGFRETIEYSPYENCMKTVVFFLAYSRDTAVAAQEEEVKEITWLPYEEAAATLTFDSDRETLRKAEAYLHGENLVELLSRGKSLTVAVDMYGCPNRCRHCWLSHMPNRKMDDGADRRILDCFRPYFDKIEFYSWFREPDFCDDYVARWERDKELSVNTAPRRFELASFWRLARDPGYVRFLKDVGVGCVQLTFFGLRETTDLYVGRKGAFDELLRATDILIENGISPRWQAFIDRENRYEIVKLLSLSEEMKLKDRTEAFGGTFRFFVHAGSCDGENRKLYPVRIRRGEVPEELIPYFLNYAENRTEKELCEKLKDDRSSFVPHNGNDIVVYVANDYDLFFNFTHTRKEWKIGNLMEDPAEELVRRIVKEDIPALGKARGISVGELVTRYGDPDSERLFEEEDYKMYLLNSYLEETAERNDIR